MNISVIGAGNTGKAISVYLKLKNNNVRLYDRDAEKVKKINESGICVTGAIDAVEFIKTYSNMDECIDGSEIILVMTTSSGHADIARCLKHSLQPNQSIVIFNGNWGAYEFNDILADKINKLNISIAETSSMVFTAAHISDTSVNMKKIKEMVEIGYLPGSERKAIKEFMSENFKGVHILNNVIETSLNNSNPIIHVPIIAANLAYIDCGKEFLFYTDGASPPSIDFVNKIDEERLLVCNKLGIKTKSILEIINNFWTDKRDNLYDAIHSNASYKTSKGPESTEHRYFTEDVPYGLCPIQSIADQLNIDTPYLDALISYLDKYLNRNYMSHENLNIKVEKIKEIIQLSKNN